MTTIFTVKRDERGSYYVLVLPERENSTQEERLNGDFIQTIGTLIARVKRIYGDEAEFVSFSKLQHELQQRQVHSPAIVAMLTRQSELFGVDASSYTVYGSPMRPMSTVWFCVADAMCIPADRQSTGYHSYVAVPQPLDKEVIEKYELEFVSHP